MDIKSLYREIVNEHNLHPTHKHDLKNPTIVLNGVNPSCGDNIVLKKHRPAGSCDFCGEVDENALQYEGYCICQACRRRISAL